MDKEKTDIIPERKKSFRILFFAAKAFFAFVLLVVVFLAIFKLPFVQDYIKKSIIETVEKRTGSTIEFDHVAVSIWNGVSLENFRLSTSSSEPVITIGKLGFSLRKNLLYVFNNELDISTIRLEGLTLRMKTLYMETESDVSRLLNRLLQRNNQDNEKTPFLLSVKEIFLKNIFVEIINENKGTQEKIFLSTGLLELEKLDLKNADFIVNQIYLNNPVYRKIIINEKCDIRDELAIAQQEQVDSMPDLLPFTFTISKIEIEKGVFGLFNQMIPIDKKFLNVMDYDHFELRDITTVFENVRLDAKNEFLAICKEVSLTSDRGFTLEKFSVDSIIIQNEGAKFKNTSILTEKTLVSSDILFSYPDYSALGRFKDEVFFTIEMEPSRVSFVDISHFVKGLITSPITQGINDKIVNLSGKYFGRMNGINGRNVKISIDNHVSFGGSFSTKNLDDYNNTLLNVKLENFVSSMQKIKKLFPTFNPPANFFKLGALRFNGRYDGYLEDFVAYGKLSTDIGSVDLDMRLDITSGVNKAQYSGELNLTKFDLAKWSDNRQFGLVEFSSKVKKGQGLTLQTLKSDIEAVVKSLTFKNYEYKNFTINGVFEKNNFKGDFEISDPNIDLKFNGDAEFIDNLAFLNFNSTIKNLDLYALNLSKSPFSIQANLNINASGSNINDVLGNIDIQNVAIQARDTVFEVAEIHLTSRNLVNGGKELKIWSELGVFQLNGIYDFNQLIPLTGSIIKSNYPSLTRNWKIKEYEGVAGQKMDFDIALKDSKHFLRLAGLNNVRFTKIDLRGKIDSYKNEISIASNIPNLIFNQDSVKNVQLLVNSYKNTGNILLHIDKAKVRGEEFGIIDFQANSKGDSILFDISGNEIVKSLKPVEISGFMTPYNKGYAFSLDAEKLNFLGSDWRFSPRNKVFIEKGKIGISDFELSDGFRTIEAEDIKGKGISLSVKNFDLDLLNRVLKDPRFVISGLSNVKADVMDVFASEKEVYANIEVPTFYINKDSYGGIDITAELSKKGVAELEVMMGEFVTANVMVDVKRSEIQGRAKLKDAPLRILEYILAKGIQNTSGTVNASVDISGPLKKFRLNGKGTVNGGQTKIIYTGVTYSFDKQEFQLTERKIDLTGVILRDSRNNPAVITGGLYHDRFNKFGVNATIEGNNVIGLQTTIVENKDYYGFAIGKLRASFNGSFENVDMVIDGVTNAGTQLYIPVGNSSAKSRNNIIRFEKRNQLIESQANIANKVLQGIDLEMNLTVTPEAAISIVFDEDKGDIISGVGRGNLQIFVKRTGAFDIFGDYQIESGNYLFTVAQLPVAKPFEVYRGGMIRWTGDPVNTTLDIQAVYKSRTSLRPFIEEYLGLASDQLASQANQRQDVDVILKLGGTLYSPEVSFNLAFPNLVGEISTLADSKLRVLQNNELELNSQVFGLIMFNNFLPSNRVADVLGTGGIQSMGINTLSEFLSSQLSLYITNLINLALVENGLLAGVDFEIGLRNNTGVVSNLGNTNVWPDEIEFRLKNRFKFLDERVTLNMGGNYIFENQGFTYNQMLPDFSLEMILTEDRKLKARVYGRQELIVQNTLSPKVGLGLAYRTEFGTLADFESSVKAAIQKSIKK